MSKTKKRVPLGDTSTRGFHSPFAQLLGDKEVPAAEDAHHVPATPSADEPHLAGVLWESQLLGLDKLVVRRERKGRGGKTVTLVEGLPALGDDGVAQLLKRLRKALGCGASAEASEAGLVLVLQGDQGERAVDFFQSLGVKRVVRGA